MPDNGTDWLKNYLELYRGTIFDASVFKSLSELKELLVKTNANGNKLMIFGNGGSAAIASHCAVDFTKNARIEAVSFDDSAFITCLANDYGFEQWMAKTIEYHAKKGDVALFISSSGKSQNIINGVEAAKRLSLPVVTFSGFSAENILRKSGDINLWVNSKAYNIVEMTHHIWLLAVVDWIIGKAEYSAS